jgi:hypothetical protein
MPISCSCWNSAFWAAIYFDTMIGPTSLWHSSLTWKENYDIALLIGKKTAKLHPKGIHMQSNSLQATGLHNR